MIDKNTTKQTWWIAHNNDSVFHYGSAAEGQRITTGQPFFETFDNRIQWEARLLEILPPDRYIEFNEAQEEEKQAHEDIKDTKSFVDHILYTDSVDHLLYGDKQFRYSENLNTGVD